MKKKFLLISLISAIALSACGAMLAPLESASDVMLQTVETINSKKKTPAQPGQKLPVSSESSQSPKEDLQVLLSSRQVEYFDLWSTIELLPPTTELVHRRRLATELQILEDEIQSLMSQLRQLGQ